MTKRKPTPVLGILILDRQYPLFKGNAGNPESYDYPVLVYRINGLYNPPSPPIRNEVGCLSNDAELFVNAAINLEKQGVKAIVASCGFFSLMQTEVSNAVDIPVFTSPLMLIPTILNLIPKTKKIGVITLFSEHLTSQYFETVNVNDFSRLVLSDMSNAREFRKMIEENSSDIDKKKLRDEVLKSAIKITQDNQDISAILIECSDMSPYSDEMRKLTGLPVFDYLVLAEFVRCMVLDQ